MAYDKQKLEELRDAIYGDDDPSFEDFEWGFDNLKDNNALDEAEHAFLAYGGSLDEAFDLHEEVLGGWFFNVGGSRAVVTNNDPFGEWFHGDATNNPARAWLIAILEALISEATQ